MRRLIGCNTLYPRGRLTNDREQFTLEAHKESLEIINDAGLDACEFSHFDVLSDCECEALRGACNSLGLTPWSAHLWSPLPADPNSVESCLEVLAPGIEKASHLGVSIVVAHAAGGALDMGLADHRLLRACAIQSTLQGLAPVLEALEISLAIENCSGRPDLEFLVEAVEDMAHPFVGLNIDTGHAILHGMTPAEAIGLMGSNLKTTHLQDNRGERDDHLPPGEGVIDWAGTFAALSQTGYDGVLMVEISDCPPGREPNAREDTATAAKNVKRFADLCA